MKRLLSPLIAGALLLASTAWSQEATIRKNLGERIPQLQQLDEVIKSPMPGLYEIRVNGTEIYYTDADANSYTCLAGGADCFCFECSMRAVHHKLDSGFRGDPLGHDIGRDPNHHLHQLSIRRFECHHDCFGDFYSRQHLFYDGAKRKII